MTYYEKLFRQYSIRKVDDDGRTMSLEERKKKLQEAMSKPTCCYHHPTAKADGYKVCPMCGEKLV